MTSFIEIRNSIPRPQGALECGAMAPLFECLRDESGGKPPHSKAPPAQ
jgi:hypothetical protein